ncbi:MAG TPA: sugar kinase [Aggregatilineales bacterium]|nr:sugar kinase [Aggregatilineales bacterium]
MPSLDLLTVGEAMLRLSVPAGDLLIDSPTLDVQVAGAENNVAVAVAQMGFQARWWSRLTDNVMGRRIAQTIAHYGVDCSEIEWTADDRVGTYYLEFGALPRPTRVIYDRTHSAASKMSPQTFPLEHIAQARLVHLTGITAALSESCYALLEAMLDRCAQAAIPVVFDVNFRALLWSADRCRARLLPLLGRVDTLIVGKQDAATVFAIDGDPLQVLRGLRDLIPVPRLALTLGDQGAIGLENDRLYPVEGYTVQVVDRIGAGDAFAAGVVCGLLRGDFPLGLRYGVAISALQLTLNGDLFRLSASDVTALLERGVMTRPIR